VYGLQSGSLPPAVGRLLVAIVRRGWLVRFEKLVPGHTTNLKVGKTRQGKGPRTPPSVTVPLPAELRGELEAVAGQYGIPLARLAREALLIGLRAIKARSEAYNRRTLGGENP